MTNLGIVHTIEAKGSGMMFYDQHMHSYISIDSDADPLQYVKNGPKYIVFTDHLELQAPGVPKVDIIPEFEVLLNVKDELASKGSELLLGVEVGYAQGVGGALDNLFEMYPFKIKILSAHHNGEYGFMSAVDIPRDEMIDSYVDTLLEAVTEWDGFHILAHFDFGFRIHEFDISEISPYETRLNKVFKTIIQKGMAFEINSRSIFIHDNKDLYIWGIKRYLELGGTLFTLGSDAHHPEDYMLGFEEIIEMLVEYGVHELVLFNGDNHRMIPLKDALEVIHRVKP